MVAMRATRDRSGIRAELYSPRGRIIATDVRRNLGRRHPGPELPFGERVAGFSRTTLHLARVSRVRAISTLYNNNVDAGDAR